MGKKSLTIGVVRHKKSKMIKLKFPIFPNAKIKLFTKSQVKKV